MASIKTALLFTLGLVLALLLISVAEGRFPQGLTGLVDAAPTCDSVYGVQSGDTCFAVTQIFNLTTESFNSLNPNLVCNNIFVGQWLCIQGSA